MTSFEEILQKKKELENNPKVIIPLVIILLALIPVLLWINKEYYDELHPIPWYQFMKEECPTFNGATARQDSNNEWKNWEFNCERDKIKYMVTCNIDSKKCNWISYDRIKEELNKNG